ncbi:MAG: hypothetical protein MJY45_05420 [Bacteroidales bacterium]|nr:hypothetical protein [Bacteroidales bacterium]
MKSTFKFIVAAIGSKIYKGVFLYPDNYDGDEVSISMTWGQINGAGIVFLPAAGYLGGPNADTGFYWSSSAADTSYVYRLRFNSVHVAPASKDVRNYGYSVRLVADCQ